MSEPAACPKHGQQTMLPLSPYGAGMVMQCSICGYSVMQPRATSALAKNQAQVTQLPMSEHDHQARLINEAIANESRYPELKLLYCIPNGGGRTQQQAARLAEEGLKSGVPDLHLPCESSPSPRTDMVGPHYIGWWGEMKKPGERPKSEQVTWHTRLRQQGHYVEVFYCWQDAWNDLLIYLEGMRR